VLLANEQTINVELKRHRARLLALTVAEVACLQAQKVCAVEDAASS
jgi:hypothetical protein